MPRARRGGAEDDRASGLDAALDAEALALAAERAPGGTACPSEVARRVFAARGGRGDGWRALMPAARAAARALAHAGALDVTQRGRVLDPDAEWRGPVRLRARRLP